MGKRQKKFGISGRLKNEARLNYMTQSSRELSLAVQKL